MTGEQSVLVFGAIAVALFILMLSLGGKKRPRRDASVNGTQPSSKPEKRAATPNRAARRKR